ncbi:hypothetical protein RIVM261_079710 [Rivularia sp. IAM M-261]|nr:hypothetical protein RIVM261_079710 [Rivularia sp. IAM M-261]
MNEEQISHIITGIMTFHWKADFNKFCTICGFDPNYAYSQEKWQQWQQLVSGLKSFDQETLAKLVQAGHSSSSTS